MGRHHSLQEQTVLIRASWKSLGNPGLRHFRLSFCTLCTSHDHVIVTHQEQERIKCSHQREIAVSQKLDAVTRGEGYSVCPCSLHLCWAALAHLPGRESRGCKLGVKLQAAAHSGANFGLGAAAPMSAGVGRGATVTPSR